MKMLKFTTVRALLLGINMLLHADISKASYPGYRGYFQCRNTVEERVDRSTQNDDKSCFTGGQGTENINCPSHTMNNSSEVTVNCTRKYTCMEGTPREENYICGLHAICKQRDGKHNCCCKNNYHGNWTTCRHVTDCQDVLSAGVNESGIYSIKPTNWSEPAFNVTCDMDGNGGWTVFHRRVNGSVDFYRNWTNYRDGFGELDHEFWLGNEKLYYLTNQGNYTLRVDLVNSNGLSHYAEYDMFRINNENDNYRLSVLGVYDGNAGTNALKDHLNHSFSTFDRDNDGNSGNCASNYHGGWWYSNCRKSNLNGDYDGANNPSTFWQGLPGNPHNLRRTEMKIRPQ